MKEQKINYSLLELAMISQGETIQQTLHHARDIAKEAEAQNYKRIWFAEHHNSENIGSSATSLLVGYVAENTSTIKVGSGGIMLPNHSPLIIAEQFGTLAHLYPGRIDLGLGRAPGTDVTTAQAIRSDFFQASRSFPEEVAKLQRYFSVENNVLNVRVNVAEGINMPFYILGSSTDSAHLAAKMGLPYAFASHFASTHLHNALQIYKDEFQASKTLQLPYTIAGVGIYIADTDAEAEKLFTSMLNMFAGMLTGNFTPIQPPTEMTAELKSLQQHPTAQQMLKYAFVGSKQTVKEKLKAFTEQTGVDELIATSTIYSFQDRIKSMKAFADNDRNQ